MEDPTPTPAEPTMNSEPSLAVNEEKNDLHSGGDIASVESDHCRICRGEGTIEEPLFYPCKCNGSIRYVHQACLMQWLLHSQKKHCELCKTPFRFTKLYDPNMPSMVPWPVFIRQASIHVVRFALKCARWMLVLFVWLGWVPWCMRAVWRGLFWVGDGSWITQQQLERQTRAISNTTATATGQTLFSTRLPPIPEASATLWGPVSQTLNLSSPEPMILWFGRRLLNTIIFPYSALANSTVEIRWIEGPPRNPSLLSNVSLLKTPTRWRLVNDTLVDILEGQLITVGILVTFILMFLIREWVVQQQPMINLGAALDGEAANPQPQAQPQAVQEPIVAQVGDEADRPEEETMQPEPHRYPSPDSIIPHEDDSNKDAELLNLLANRRDSMEPLPPTPRLDEDDSIQHDAISRQDVSVGEDDTHHEYENRSYITPPDSETEDFSMDLPTLDESNVEEPGKTSRRSSPSRPAMPRKEAAVRANIIARRLEERLHLKTESLETDTLSTLDPAGVPSNTQNPREEDAGSGSASAETENETQLEPEDSFPVVIQGPSHQRLETLNDRPVKASIIDWMWGDVPEHDNDSDDTISEWQTEAGSNDGTEHADHEIDNGDDLINLEGGNEAVLAQPNAEAVPVNQINNEQQDPEVLRAAAEAGIDANEVEQVEEGEDMDGVMELIGMQGPLAGLLQNGMFSTVIISMTVLFGIWLPYLLGKLVLIVLANPISLLVKMPLRWTSTIADLIVDSFIFFALCSYYWLDRFIRLTAGPFGWAIPFVETARLDDNVPRTAYRLTWSAADRLAKNLALTGGYFSDSDIPVFSILAHESLKTIQGTLYRIVAWTFDGIKNVVEAPSSITYFPFQAMAAFKMVYGCIINTPINAAAIIPYIIKNGNLNLDMLKINLEIPARSEPLKISSWSASDRVLTVMLGYAFFASLGFVYLKVRKLFSDAQNRERPVDGLFVEILNQAGGVFKVILIITIEMLVFPLYCGFLLDTALLPLFSNASLSTRMAFLSNSPWTSVFIHWFAGTCYMFHFALFVAMCRKILRTGVLYFIRDPDDPSFHPVRDVLERNVTTQLRKILFSALVYGALVIVCLGAVVWSISTIVKSVFPIHWSSNEPVLEFPADLLVYNFLMPLAVKVFKPSSGLQDMYNWWFRKCARLLRLSHFLFNERNKDEEGYVVWKKVAADEEIEEAKARKDFKWPIVRDGRLSWKTRSTKHSRNLARRTLERRRSAESDPPAGYKKKFIHDGRLVRAPASDQVRIPKGNKTFVDIDRNTGKRKDGLPENPTGLHGKDNNMFSDIYVPPYFRVRIASFIILIWAFAAMTGVSFTIIPLLFGRFLFSRLIQSHPRMNDIYAFAIGFYVLAGPVWLVMKFRPQITRFAGQLRSSTTSSAETARTNLPKTFRAFLQCLRALYFYGSFMILLPSLVGLVWEAYMLIPLHTYFQRTDHAVPPHTVHFVSDWTLGVLFVRVAVHVMLKYPQSRPTKALLALVSPQNRGSSWWDPDIRLATRAFIIPLTILSIVALLLPLGLSRLLLSTIFEELGEGPQTIIYRYSYPIFMAMNLSFALLRASRRGVNRWRSRVRDEVYLVGERLHNFDGRRGKVVR